MTCPRMTGPDAVTPLRDSYAIFMQSGASPSRFPTRNAAFSPGNGNRGRKVEMLDFMVIIGVAAAFAVAVGYAFLCEGL